MKVTLRIMDQFGTKIDLIKYTLSGNKLRSAYHFGHTFADVISLARLSTGTFLRQKGKSFSLFSLTKWRLITRILSYAVFSPNAVTDFLFSQISVFF